MWWDCASLHNALANIAAEMAIVMMKTSYSTIFNKGLDRRDSLDRQGNLIAEKNFAPAMAGAVNLHRCAGRSKSWERE